MKYAALLLLFASLVAEADSFPIEATLSVERFDSHLFSLTGPNLLIGPPPFASGANLLQSCNLGDLCVFTVHVASGIANPWQYFQLRGPTTNALFSLTVSANVPSDCVGTCLIQGSVNWNGTLFLLREDFSVAAAFALNGTGTVDLVALLGRPDNSTSVPYDGALFQLTGTATPIPEPATLTLLVLGIGTLAYKIVQ